MAWLWRKLLVEEKQTEDKLTHERVEENCRNIIPLLKLIPGCESMNNHDIQEWMNQDKNN
jgi:hypothetical protein